MDNDIQKVEETSVETQNILKELAAEGNEVPGLTPEPPKEPPKEIPKEEPKVVEPPKVEETPKEPPKVDKPRTSNFVPVNKYNEMRHELATEKAAKADLEAKLAQATQSITNKSTPEEVDDAEVAAKMLAEEHGLDENLAKSLAKTMVDIASKRAKVPDDILQKIQKFDEREANQLKQVEDDATFETTFADVVKEFPALISKKDDIKQLAFTEGYESTPIRTLAIEYLHDNPVTSEYGAEPPSGGKGATVVLDYDNLTEEQLSNFTPEEMDKFNAYIVKKSGKL